LNYAEQLRAPASGHRTGLVVVVALHILLGWALVDGLHTRVIDIVKPAVDVTVVKDVQTPRPPPDPVLPQPKNIQLPQHVIPVPTEIPIARNQEPAITGSPDAIPVDRPWTDSSAASSASGVSTTPRAVAKPAIANVQACAPGAEDYPAAARRAEATGITRLRFTIDAAGALVRSEIVKPAGTSREHRMLDRVAESKLASCYFTAGVDENGRAMGGTFEVDYVWKLE
jgi:periplasmic protein TonB